MLMCKCFFCFAFSIVSTSCRKMKNISVEVITVQRGREQHTSHAQPFHLFPVGSNTDTCTSKCPAVNQTLNVNQFHKTQFGKRSWSTNGSKSCKENRSGGKRVRCPEASQRPSTQTTNACVTVNWNSLSCKSLYFRLKQLLMLSFSSVFIFKTHPIYPACRQNSVPQTFGALQRLC